MVNLGRCILWVQRLLCDVGREQGCEKGGATLNTHKSVMVKPENGYKSVMIHA